MPLRQEVELPVHDKRRRVIRGRHARRGARDGLTFGHGEIAFDADRVRLVVDVAAVVGAAEVAMDGKGDRRMVVDDGDAEVGDVFDDEITAERRLRELEGLRRVTARRTRHREASETETDVPARVPGFLARDRTRARALRPFRRARTGA